MTDDQFYALYADEFRTAADIPAMAIKLSSEFFKAAGVYVSYDRC